MPGEIATIHRGHIVGLEWMELARVVPVVEVAVEQIHAAHRRQRGFQALNGFHGAQPPEITRGNRGEKIQPHIGRRRAVGYDGFRVFLKIIGRKCVIRGTDKRLEEAPRPACNQSKSPPIGRRQGLYPGKPRRQADPSRDGGSGGPEKEERNRSSPRLLLSKSQSHTSRGGEDNTACHALIHTEDFMSEGILGLCCGHPLQQMFPRDHKAAEGAQNCVRYQPCLVRQKRHR